MKIYIAGHTGFIGKALTNKLMSDSKDRSLIFADRKALDLRDTNKVNEFFYRTRPDQVYICSAIVGGIKANMENPYKFLFENLVIQNNLIEACIQYKIKKVLYLGSSCVYPKDYKQPLKEEYLMAGPLEETNCGYALAKIAGLKLCEYANKQFDTKFISLMPCNIIGSGATFDSEKSHVFNALIKKIYDAKIKNENKVTIWGDGLSKREFLHIGDLIDCMVWSMAILENTDTFLNVGVGYAISIKELAEKIANKIGYRGDFTFDLTKPNGMRHKLLDSARINLLGWSPKVTLDASIDEVIKEYAKK